MVLEIKVITCKRTEGNDPSDDIGEFKKNIIVVEDNFPLALVVVILIEEVINKLIFYFE